MHREMSRDIGIVERIDDMGKPVWIALLVLLFIVAWPVALALLAFLIWSGRMSCGRHQRRLDKFREKLRAKFGEHGDQGRGRWYYRSSSGNVAFDEYREETLRRLEGEEREFRDFLDRLRHAKDKEEFDRFMTERVRREPASDGEPGAAPAA